MENTEALKWAAVYLGLWVLSGVVGLAIVGIGVGIGALSGTGISAYTPLPLTDTAYPAAGRLLVALGLLAWKLGSAAAFLKVLTEAFGAETERQLNTEAVKSDILSVLDSRLSEMHGEISEARRAVDRAGGDDADEFEFDEG